MLEKLFFLKKKLYVIKIIYEFYFIYCNICLIDVLYGHLGTTILIFFCGLGMTFYLCIDESHGKTYSIRDNISFTKPKL